MTSSMLEAHEMAVYVAPDTLPVEVECTTSFRVEKTSLDQA